MKPQIVAIVSDDYYATPNDHVVLPPCMDLDQEKVRWLWWYRNVYCSAVNRAQPVDYVSFVDWILNRGARRATPDELVVWP